jgi:hypothetical protein
MGLLDILSLSLQFCRSCCFPGNLSSSNAGIRGKVSALNQEKNQVNWKMSFELLAARFSKKRIGTLYRCFGEQQAHRGKNISFLSVMPSISAAFLVLAVMLGDDCTRGLDVDAGIQSGGWVGGNDRENQFWGGSCFIDGRSEGGGRLDSYVRTADSCIESVKHPPGARDGGFGSGVSSSGGGSSGGGSSGDGSSDGDGDGGDTDTVHEQADRSRNRCRKEGSDCRGAAPTAGNGSNGIQGRGRLGTGKHGKDGHYDGSGSLGGVVGRNGGKGTGRVERERSWIGIINDRVTEGEYVGLKLLRCGEILGFDKDNPWRQGH